MLVLKQVLKKENYEFCPLCGTKIEFDFEDLQEAEPSEPSELDLLNENDWLLP